MLTLNLPQARMVMLQAQNLIKSPVPHPTREMSVCNSPDGRIAD